MEAIHDLNMQTANNIRFFFLNMSDAICSFTGITHISEKISIYYSTKVAANEGEI